MFGHKWEKFTGTVVDMSAGQGAVPGQQGMQLVFSYAIDARLPDGTAGRVEVSEPQGGPSRQPGSIVHLERNPKTGELRFDPDVSAQFGIGAGTMAQMQQTAFVTGSRADRLRAATGQGGAMIFATTTRIGPDGMVSQAGPGAGINPAEMQQLAAAMMSGDAAARAQAKARLREIQSQVLAQTAGAGGAGFGDPALGAPAPFGGPQQPVQAGFGPANPGDLAGQPPAQPSPQDRITQLQELRDKGILTQSEYDAKRQQIIDQI